MSREIVLSGGLVALVDDDDYERVIAAGLWHARRNGWTVYAQRHVRLPDGRRSTEQLHRFLTGWPMVDHRNRNGLDNRRENLRPATQSQNNGNTKARAGTSKFKGVSWRKHQRQWWAQIRQGEKTRHLGYYEAEEDAARAYDAAAIEYFGEFARPNFPECVS